MEQKYVAYYRVSTKGQNLGIDAQKTMVATFVKDTSLIIASYEEKESGKDDDRPELLKALALCKRKKATLVIAKLDRLSRKLSFISSLMDSGVKFVCCDMPHANEMTIQIMAVMAQHERKVISERTKAALAELKKKGKKLGSPQNMTEYGRRKGAAAIRAKSIPVDGARELASRLRKENLTLQQIADMLNAKGYRSPRGGEYIPKQVSRLFEMIQNAETDNFNLAG